MNDDDDDIVFISSSNEEQSKEETSPVVSKNRNHVKHSRKRRLDFAIEYDDETKRFKPNNAKNTSEDGQDSSSSAKSQVSHSLNRSSNNGQYSPEAGTSKYFDRIEKHNSRKNSFSSKSTKALEPVRKIVKPQLVVKSKVKIPEPTDNVFENLLKTCITKRDVHETHEIIERLRKIYDKVDSTEKSNEEFRLLINRTNQRILDDSSRLYTHIRDFRDEMKRRIKRKPNTDNTIKSEVSDIQQNKDAAEEKLLSKEDMAKVKKLEHAIKKCQQRIKELEEKEVDWENEGDSTYLQEDRYKRKLVELCKLLSDIVEDNTLKKEILKKKLRRKDILEEMSGIESVDEALINLINSSVNNINKLKHIKRPTAVADYLKVPDYPDILHCIVKCNEKRGLDLSKKKMERIAEVAFKAIGNHLKKQRIQESREYVKAIQEEYPEQVDPASSDLKLNEALQENGKIGIKKLNAVFKNFVDLQDGLTPEELEKQVEENSNSSSDVSDEETNETKCNKINNKIIEESSEDEVIEESIVENDQNKSRSNDDKVLKFRSEKSFLTVNIIKSTKECEKNTVDKLKYVKTKSDSVHSTDEESTITDIKKSGKTSADSNKSIIKNVDSEKQSENDHISISTVCKVDSVNRSINTKSNEADQKDIITADVDECMSDTESIMANEEDPLTIVADVEDDCEGDPKLNLESKNSSALEKKMDSPCVIESKNTSTISNHAPKLQKELEIEISEISKIDENCKIDSVATDSPIQLSSVSNISKANQDRSASVSSNNEKTDEACSVEKNVELVKSKQNFEKSSPTKESQSENSSKVLNEESKECAKEDEVIYVIESEEKADLGENDEDKDGPEDKLKPDSEKLYIKVRDFAISPMSWKDPQSLSQESNKRTEIPNQQEHSTENEPYCIDLTNEPEKCSPKSTRILNPLAVSQRRIPVQNVVVIKNVINNHTPLPSVRTRDFSLSSNIRVPHGGKNYKIPRRPDVVDRVTHPSQPDIVRKPFVQSHRSKDQHSK